MTIRELQADVDRQAALRVLVRLIEREEEGGTGAQITGFNRTQLVPLLRRGGTRYRDPGCEERIAALEGVDAAGDRTNLLYPRPDYFLSDGPR